MCADQIAKSTEIRAVQRLEDVAAGNGLTLSGRCHDDPSVIGCGVAFFDYDNENDRRMDPLVLSKTRLSGARPGAAHRV